MMARVAALHRAFLADPPSGLVPLDRVLGLFAPIRLRTARGDATGLAALALRGWEMFDQCVPRDVADAVLGLLEDLEPLAAALGSGRAPWPTVTSPP